MVNIHSPVKRPADDYIPCHHTGFRAKATPIRAADITKETYQADGKTLKSAICKLASKKGAYIIVSSKTEANEKMLSTRKEAMQACSDSAQEYSRLVTDFYDCRRLAD